MRGYLLIWCIIGVVVGENVLLKRTDRKRSGSPIAGDARRQRGAVENPVRQHTVTPSGSGFSLAQSSSSDSFDMASMKTRVDGPGFVNHNRADFDLKVGGLAQMTHKAWHNERLSSRASIGTTRSPSGRKAQMIAKGTSVKALLDTTRGGHGYIRTTGREGYQETKVNPGERVKMSATSNNEVRAKLKAKLSGGGVLRAEGVYREDTRSPSMSSDGSSGLGQGDSASVGSRGPLSDGKAGSGQSGDSEPGLSSGHSSHRSRGRSVSNQSKDSTGSRSPSIRRSGSPSDGWESAGGSSEE